MRKRLDYIHQNNARVANIELAIDEQGSWHTHTFVTETLYGGKGSAILELALPYERRNLTCGSSYQIPPGRPHRIINGTDTPASYLLIQNGLYDLVVWNVPELDLPLHHEAQGETP